jgi:hypothetical protein
MRAILKRACDAVGDLNSDVSVPAEKTLADLEELQGQVEGYIEALKEQAKFRSQQ